MLSFWDWSLKFGYCLLHPFSNWLLVCASLSLRGVWTVTFRTWGMLIKSIWSLLMNMSPFLACKIAHPKLLASLLGTDENVEMQWPNTTKFSGVKPWIQRTPRRQWSQRVPSPSDNTLKKDITSDHHEPAVTFSGPDFPSLHIYKQFLIRQHECKMLLHTPAFTPHG